MISMLNFGLVILVIFLFDIIPRCHCLSTLSTFNTESLMINGLNLSNGIANHTLFDEAFHLMRNYFLERGLYSENQWNEMRQEFSSPALYPPSDQIQQHAAIKRFMSRFKEPYTSFISPIKMDTKIDSFRGKRIGSGIVIGRRFSAKQALSRFIKLSMQLPYAIILKFGKRMKTWFRNIFSFRPQRIKCSTIIPLFLTSLGGALMPYFFPRSILKHIFFPQGSWIVMIRSIAKLNTFISKILHLPSLLLLLFTQHYCQKSNNIMRTIIFVSGAICIYILGSLGIQLGYQIHISDVIDDGPGLLSGLKKGDIIKQIHYKNAGIVDNYHLNVLHDGYDGDYNNNYYNNNNNVNVQENQQVNTMVYSSDGNEKVNVQEILDSGNIDDIVNIQIERYENKNIQEKELYLLNRIFNRIFYPNTKGKGGMNMTFEFQRKVLQIPIVKHCHIICNNQNKSSLGYIHIKEFNERTLELVESSIDELFMKINPMYDASKYTRETRRKIRGMTGNGISKIGWNWDGVGLSCWRFFISLFTNSDELEDIKRNKSLDGLVLDLRGNLGGTLPSALDVAALFLKDSMPLMRLKSSMKCNYPKNRGLGGSGLGFFPRDVDEEKKGEGKRKKDNAEFETTVHYSTNHHADLITPLLILIDDLSASASEIIISALCESGRAISAGQTTTGKDIAQAVMELSDGSGISMTVRRFESINKNSLALGVSPDYDIQWQEGPSYTCTGEFYDFPTLNMMDITTRIGMNDNKEWIIDGTCIGNAMTKNKL